MEKENPNWPQRFEDAQIRLDAGTLLWDVFTVADKILAAGWYTCACWDLDPRIARCPHPNYPQGAPGAVIDDNIANRALLFHRAVESGDINFAKRMRAEIKMREAELIAGFEIADQKTREIEERMLNENGK